jgi:hypothetical protein
MFLINKDKNRIEKISEKTFSELGFKERNNLQEWLANNPSALGEELLIIQKEFDGFSDTNERLDLLALDKQGNLVIIENKLDDSGKDVVWQSLKYASYCSSLKKSQIIKIYQDYLNKNSLLLNAEESISDFLEGFDIEEVSLNSGLTQRLILVSGKFRKEVTSTVIWLINYGIRLQCFQVTPYSLDEQLFLNIEQIIPMKEAEEFSISMVEKTQEDIASQEEVKTRHIIRMKFWNQVINSMNNKSDLFQNISAGKQNWISAGSGVRNVGYNFVATKDYFRAEMYIDRKNDTENNFIFESLYKNKEEIEAHFGSVLIWDRLESRRACRIKYEYSDFNIFNSDTWDNSIEVITNAMVKIFSATKPLLTDINKSLKLF